MKKALIIIIIIVILLLGFVIGIYYYALAPADNVVEQDNEQVNQEIEKVFACSKLGCPQGSVYAGSSNSDKYYLCDCRWAKNVVPENLVCFASDEQALADNRTKSEC